VTHLGDGLQIMMRRRTVELSCVTLAWACLDSASTSLEHGILIRFFIVDRSTLRHVLERISWMTYL
jgi:hypothetical protein